MKPTKAESIAKLAQWCVENSSETFSAFFRYYPHTNDVDIDTHNDGWEKNNSVSNNFELLLDDHESAYVEELVGDTITELNTLLAKSNFRNCKMLKSSTEKSKTIVTPAMTQDDLKAEREADELAKAKSDLEKAKAVIDRLEGKQ